MTKLMTAMEWIRAEKPIPQYAYAFRSAQRWILQKRMRERDEEIRKARSNEK